VNEGMRCSVEAQGEGKMPRDKDRPILHRICDWNDIADGEAESVICPDCGQLEIWSIDELIDHGLCRFGVGHTADGRCPVCNDQLIEE